MQMHNYRFCIILSKMQRTKQNHYMLIYCETILFTLKAVFSEPASKRLMSQFAKHFYVQQNISKINRH